MLTARSVRSLLFLSVFLAVGVMLFLTFGALKREERLLSAASKENLYWTAAQLEIELQRYTSELGRFASAVEGSSADLVRRRFDILWSRAHLFDQGEVGARMTAFGSVRAAVAELQALLAASEDRVETLADADHLGAVALLAEASRKRLSVRNAVTVLVQAEEARSREIRKAIAENHRRTVLIGAGALGIGAIFVCFLYFDLRTSIREAKRAAALAAGAEASNRAKTRFLELMSHELRTPFNGLIGLIALARNGSIGGQEAGYLDRAADSARAFTETLDSALACFELDDGTAPSSRFAPGRTLRSVIAMTEPQAAQAGVALRCARDEDVGALVIGDALGFRRLAIRLIAAALKLPDVEAIDVDLVFDAADADGPRGRLVVRARCRTALTAEILAAEDWHLEVARAMAARLNGALEIDLDDQGRWTSAAALRFDAPPDAEPRVWLEPASRTSGALLAVAVQRAGGRVVDAPHEADLLLVESDPARFEARADRPSLSAELPMVFVTDETVPSSAAGLRLSRPVRPQDLKTLFDRIFSTAPASAVV